MKLSQCYRWLTGDEKKFLIRAKQEQVICYQEQVDKYMALLELCDSQILEVFRMREKIKILKMEIAALME
jgi:hypothetical protein